MRQLLKHYKNDERGNFSTMFSLTFLALMLGIGVAIDVTLLFKSHLKLQNITDSAILAATRFDGTEQEKREVFVQYVNQSVKISEYRGVINNADIVYESDGKTLTLQGRVDAEYIPMIIQAFSDVDSIKTVSTAKLGINDVEVALVLDISSSMNGQRITEAKESTRMFIDTILDDGGLNQRVSVSLIPFGGTVRVPEEFNFLLETPDGGLEAYSENWIDEKWNQCFEFETNDINDGLDPDKQYKVTPDFWSWNKSNPWCPQAGSEMIPLTTDKQKLLAQVDTLTLSDGTGSDHGMLWGYEVLANDWENRLIAEEDAPIQTPQGAGASNASDEAERLTKKVIIFMTDGGITGQHHVLEQDQVGEPPYNSRKKNRIKTSDSKVTFNELCNKAKNEDMLIYTIGYTITKANHINPLKVCASETENYLNAASGDLGTVFEGLATEISPLRISN